MTDNEIVELKIRLHFICCGKLQDRVEKLKASIAEAQLVANEETKSSVGDKYETGRAMVQLEIEKFQLQLSSALKIMDTLKQFNSFQRCDIIRQGAVVETSRGFFYLLASVGEVLLDEVTYITISLASPLGEMLKGKSKGYEFNLNGNTYLIKSVI